jgi:signal transduction histidine kinase
MAAHSTATGGTGQILDETQRRGQLVLRTLPILLIPVFVGVVFVVLIRFVLGIAPPPPDAPNFLPVLIALVTITIFFTAVIALVRLGRSTLSTLLLVSVWTLITTVMAVQDGVTAIWPAMLVVPICAAGLLIDSVASISLAALAMVLVASLGWLEWQGIGFKFTAPPSFPPGLAPIISASFWISLFWTTAALTSLLSRGLQRSVQHSRAQAQALSELSVQLEERVVAQTAKLLTQEREAARLEERTRVARDIHDTLAQGLTGVVVQLGAAQRALEIAPSDAGQHLELARRMARESLAEARRSIWNLRAPMSQNTGLGEALQGLAAYPLSSGVKVTYNQQGAVWPLPANAESALLRVCHEALANISRHSGARSAFIVLEYADDCVRLCVGDDGVGFDKALLTAQTTTASPWGGFGLIGMRERIQALGGTLTLRNDPGALVSVEIPRSSESQPESA